LWGYGEITNISAVNNEDSIAQFSDFKFFDINQSAIELESSLYSKIKSLDTWNPSNSIIEINQEIYGEILKNQLQMNITDESKLRYKSYDDLIAFIENHKKNENYQPVVIKILTENPNGLTKQEIQYHLRNYNPLSESQSMTDTVLSVLTRNEIIKKESDKYILNIKDQLNSNQENTIQELCSTIIKEFQNKSITVNTSNGIYTEDETNLEKFEDNNLEIPEIGILKNTINEIKKDLLIDDIVIKQIIINLLSGRHILLAGPVGTGKTTLAEIISGIPWKDGKGYYPEIYTAHSEWSTEDVIGGLLPRIDKNGEPTYEIVLGCVGETVSNNWSKVDPIKRISINYNQNEKFWGTWLIIDEFNRADIDKAFGQLLTALETHSLKIPIINEEKGNHKSKRFKEIKIPRDYRIIATLNTSDKHYLFKLSDALKRRFAYIEVNPPGREDRVNEINYALQNADTDIQFDLSYIIPKNENGRYYDPNNKTNINEEVIKLIELAYQILDLVRLIKPLGTAILKTIYQTFLVGIYVKNLDKDSQNITFSDHEVLDIALNSSIISQLENVPITSLETLYEFLFGDVCNFFQRKFNSIEKQQYLNDFKRFLDYIYINIDFNNQEDKSEMEKTIKTNFDRFKESNLKNEEWQDIRNNNQKKYRSCMLIKDKFFQSQLFKSSLEDLIKNSYI
jgi:MoxR-like ATPase